MNENRALLGQFSAFGTLILLALVAWNAGVFGPIFSDLLLLVTGNVRAIEAGDKNFLFMIPVLLGVVVIELPCSILAGHLQNRILGSRKGEHAVDEMLKNMKDGNHFFTFFVLVLVEELVFRWLFLGLLTKISFFSGTIAFYGLCVVGVVIFALMHLSNYKNSEDRNILRALPHFVGGIFLAYVFVKYGLLAAILTHFASNAVAFATYKVQRANIVDGMLVGYSLLCAAASYALMDKPLSEMAVWFINTPVFQIPGWGFRDYFLVSVFLPSCLSATFGLLLYDRGNAGKDETGVLASIGYQLAAAPIIIGLLFLIYWGFGFVITNVSYRVLILAIIFCFLHRGASANAMSRTFWSSLPTRYISICIMEALGFWAAIGWFAVSTVVQTPAMILVRYDD